MSHDHTIRNDRIDDKLAMANALGAYKIPTAMTWPLAQIKGALRNAAEAWADAKQMLQDQHTEGKFVDVEGSEKESGGVKPKRFVPDPVYQTDDDGAPKFKMDAKGQPTTERLIAQGKVQLKNSVLWQRELREMERQTVTITVPHLSWPQLEGKVAAIEANIVEALAEFFDNPPDAAKAEPAAVAGGRRRAAATT